MRPVVGLWSKSPSLHWSQGFKDYSKHNKRNEYLKFVLVRTWLFAVLGVTIWSGNSFVRLATLLCNFCMQNRGTLRYNRLCFRETLYKGDICHHTCQKCKFYVPSEAIHILCGAQDILYLRGITLPCLGLFSRHVFLLKNQDVAGRTIWRPKYNSFTNKK